MESTDNKQSSSINTKKSDVVQKIKDIDFPPEGPGGSDDKNFQGQSEDENIADIDIDNAPAPSQLDTLASLQTQSQFSQVYPNSNQDQKFVSNQIQNQSQIASQNLNEQNQEQNEQIQFDEKDDFQNFKRIADLTWEQKLAEKQKFWDTKWLEYKDGDYIDGVDSVQKWCLAQIVTRDAYSAKIHFDGWSSKWDVIYKWNSYKIAPFRRYSQGYTGQIRTPLRQNMTFDINELVEQTQRIINLTKNKFFGLTAKQITQYLRGTLFVYTDFLLSGYQIYTDEDQPKLYAYFKAVILLICEWMKEIPKLLQKVVPDIKKDSDIFLVDEDVAIYQSYYEIFGLLHRFFLGCHRCIRFFLMYDIEVEQFKNPVTIQTNEQSFKNKKIQVDQEYDIDGLKERVYDKDKYLIFGLPINFLNYFSENDGFQLIIEILKTGNIRPSQSQSKSVNEKEETYELISLDFLNQILITFSNCGHILSQQFSVNFVQTVQNILNLRFINIKDKDIKELNKDDISKFLRYYQQFLLIAQSQQEVSQTIEKLQLMLSVRFLNTSYLEKKLQGIQDLRNMIDRVETRQILEKQTSKFLNSDQLQPRPLLNYLTNANNQKIYPTQFIDRAYLKEWIINEKVAENLFGEGSHPELFKRSVQLIKFLCKSNGITQEVIDLIWKSQLGKHEETVRVIYNTIIELVIDLPLNLLNYLFSKILEVPLNLYNEMYLQFLKDFTVQALEGKERQEYILLNKNRIKNQESKQQEQIVVEDPSDKDILVFQDLKLFLENPEKIALMENEDLFGLPIFWNLIQDSFDSNLELKSAEILDISLKAIHEILNKQCASKLRIYYLLKALNNLKNGQSLYPTISIIITIIQNFDNQIMLQRENQRYEMKNLITSQQSIIQIEKQIGIINIIMNDIINYYNQVKEAIKTLSQKNKVPLEKIENYIFVGRSNHLAIVEKLFEILEYIIITSEQNVTLNTKNIEILWKIYVLQPNFQMDQNNFLQFINKRRFKKGNNQIEGYISNRQKQEINILTAKEQNYLFTQILCNSTFLDYQKITLGEAKCFQTYFQLINKEEGNLGIFQKKVEVNNFQKLLGLQSLWRITFDSLNEKATEQCGELLIDLHLRISNNYSQEGRKVITSQFIEKCMQQLLEISQYKYETVKIDSNNLTQEELQQSELVDGKILKVVQMLTEFLSRYEGKKSIKPAMKQIPYQYQHIQPYTIQVVCSKGQNQQAVEGRIQVSQFETNGAVRERCAAYFGLEINEFHLKYKNGLVDPEEDDDKYIKDHGISSQIYMIANQAYNKLNHPKYLISQNQEYFDLLFQLLTSSGAILIEPVWELLQQLPVNKKLHEDIKNLQGAQQNWNCLLDSASTHKLLYSLKIIQGLDEKSISGSKAIQSLQQDQTKNEDQSQILTQWKQKFIELGGFHHLLKIFKGVQVTKIDSKLTLMWIETMLNVLIDFLQINSDLQNVILENSKEVVFKSLQYIHSIGVFTLDIESQRGDSFEDVEFKRNQAKLAKSKVRSLQSQNQSKKGVQNQDEGNSDGEDDEINKKYNMILKEFGSIKTIAESIFIFIQKYVFLQQKSALSFFEQFPDLKSLIKLLMIETENWALRSESGRQLKQIIVSCKGDPSLQSTIITSIKIILIEILPKIQQNERRSFQFFSMIKMTLEELDVQDLVPLNEQISEIIKKIASDIKLRETKESNTKQEDKILVGYMTILKALLQKYPKQKLSIGKNLVPHLLNDCLFQVSHESSGCAKKPKCKSILSRKGALQLLSALSRDCIENLQILLEYLKNFDHSQSWRTNKQSDWQITHLDDEKSTTGYVGLKNLGCICYMISLFQQLFMVPGFCQDILNCNDPNHNNSEPDENMFLQFQSIFAGLLKSEKQYVNPKGFCHAFKDWEGQPTNVLEQMDVEEFLQMFLDRLETAIKGTKQQNTIQYHFGGKFASEMICKGCPHYYERSEPFLSIGVPVKNKRSIQEGLNAFIQGDMLEGDNAYLCAKCDKKIDTLKRTCVKELPRYLIITLKRFEFDFDRMMRVKVNDFCEFPLELDMLPYTQEGLQRKEKAALNKQENDNEEELIEEDLQHPKDYYEFKLKGIVVHSGTADSGHYYSFIKDYKAENGEKWYEFNDNIVRDFDLADLANECFGGDEIFQGVGQGQINFKSQKWGNAYLVIYERKNQNEMKHSDDDTSRIDNTQNSDNNKNQENQEQQSIKSVLDPEHPIQLKITLENQKYWQNKFLFGTEYFEFVSEICHYWDSTNIIPQMNLNRNNDQHITGFKVRNKQDPNLKIDITQPLDEIYDLKFQHANNLQIINDSAHQVFKFTSRFYFTILCRAQNKSLVPRFVDSLKSYLNYDSRNGKWLIKQLSNWILIEEIFLQLQGQEMPKIAVGIVYCAMLSIYEEEKSLLNIHWEQIKQYKSQNQEIKETNIGVLGNFILLLLSHLYDLENFNLNIPHYFQILSRFASLGPEAREFLLRSRVVGRCMDFFFDRASPYRDDFSDMSDLGIININQIPEIGLPTKIDSKMTTFFQMIQEQRRVKFITQAIPKYKYMFELLSYCVFHLNVGGKFEAPFQLDHGISKLETFIDPKESDIFVPEAGFLKKVISESKRLRSMWAICRAQVHYASLEQDQIKELFKTVYLGLRDNDYDLIRPFLCLFEVLITCDHPNIICQRNTQLIEFLTMVKSNSIFYKWMETVFEFIFRLTCRYKSIREWFYKQQNEWKFLIDWVNLNQKVPHPAQQSNNIQLYKFNQNNNQIQQLQFNDTNETLRNIISLRFRQRRFQQLLQQNLPDLSGEIDMERQDLQDFKFIAGDLVLIYDRKREDLQRWKVVRVLDEMINIQILDTDTLNKGKMCWQKCDTDKLKLESHFRQSQRNKIREDIKEQIIAQRQEAIRSHRQSQIMGEQEVNSESKKNQQQKQKQVSAGGDTEGASSHEAGSEAYGSSDDDNQEPYN